MGTNGILLFPTNLLQPPAARVRGICVSSSQESLEAFFSVYLPGAGLAEPHFFLDMGYPQSLPVVSGAVMVVFGNPTPLDITHIVWKLSHQYERNTCWAITRFNGYPRRPVVELHTLRVQFAGNGMVITKRSRGLCITRWCENPLVVVGWIR